MSVAYALNSWVSILKEGLLAEVMLSTALDYSVLPEAQRRISISFPDDFTVEKDDLYILFNRMPLNRVDEIGRHKRPVSGVQTPDGRFPIIYTRYGELRINAIALSRSFKRLEEFELSYVIKGLPKVMSVQYPDPVGNQKYNISWGQPDVLYLSASPELDMKGMTFVSTIRGWFFYYDGEDANRLLQVDYKPFLGEVLIEQFTVTA